MTRLLFALCFFSLVLTTGCGSDEPDVAITTDTASDAAVRIAEADARRAEAEARLAEAQAGGDEASGDAPATTSSPSTSSAPATSAPSGAASTRPGLSGLPAATAGPNYTNLVDGTRPFRFCQTYARSDVSRFVGMELCYAGTVRQVGTTFIGSGEKDTENGQKLTGAARTDFRLEGYLYQDLTLRFNFTDKGTRRVSRGSANLPETGYDGGCEGHGWNNAATFQTDAANSSGTATFFVEQNCGV